MVVETGSLLETHLFLGGLGCYDLVSNLSGETEFGIRRLIMFINPLSVLKRK